MLRINPSLNHANTYPWCVRVCACACVCVRARLKRITAAGKPAGILVVGNPEQAAMWLEEGFTFVAVDYDLSILAREADRIRKLYKD